MDNSNNAVMAGEDDDELQRKIAANKLSEDEN